MASPVRSWQDLASSSTTTTRLEPGKAPPTASSSPSSSSLRPQATPSLHPSRPRLLGSTARLPPFRSTSSPYQIRRRCIEVGGTTTWKGAFRLSCIGCIRMSCLRAFSSRMRQARWMGGSSRGFRRSQTAVVGTQWKGGERVGEARASGGQRGFQILNLIQHVFVVLGFLDVD